MNILDMTRHYTSILFFGKIKRVVAKWEFYDKVTEWGWMWRGGYLLELRDGRWAHIHGWWESDAPWMNQAWTYTDYFDEYPIEILLDEKWQSWRLERTDE